MKKRFFGILFVLAALVALCAVSVSAEDVDFTTGSKQYCQHCEADVEWLPLTQTVMDGWGNDYDPTNGTHYYVCYTEEGQTGVKLPSSTGLTIAAGEELCLHLNGKKLLRDGPRGFGLSGTLNIMDHAAQEGSVVAYAKTDSTGMVVRLGSSGAEFNLYGGTLQMKTASSAYAKAGGCVYVVKGAAFNMYGGTLTDGIAITGGNLYVASGGTANLLGGTITGGQASTGDGLGGNVYSAGTVTLGNCNVTGGSALTLGDDLYFPASGKLQVKKEFAGEAKVAFNAAHLPDPIDGGYLTETLDTCEGPFTGKLLLTKDGATYELYGKENDTKLYVKEKEIEDVDFSAGGTVNGWCQQCKTNVNWLPLTEAVSKAWGKDYSEADGTHYYVADDKVKLAGGILTVAAGEELCLHLNGNTLYRGDIRAFNVAGTLNIMDHAANEGLLYAYASDSSTGGVIRLTAATGVLNLYGGTLQMKVGSYHSNCVSGGVVYMIKGSTFNMYGGTLADGRAESGGNLYIGENGKFTMTGGTMTGGVAIYKSDSEANSGMGGNIFIAANATVNISDATLTKGQAAKRGGNIVTTATNITLNITDSVISDGSCDTHGGNMYLNNGYITITDTVITGGTSKSSGGNIITYAGAAKEENYLKLLGCTVTDGTAGTWGGNVYVSGNSSGTGTLTLGNSTVTGGKSGNSGDNIFVAETGKLAVTKDFAGETSVRFNSALVSDPVRGGSITAAGGSCEGPFTGKLYIENDAQRPEAYGKTGDTTLYIKAAAIVGSDGTKVWYDSNADAVAAYNSNAKYLVANRGQLELNGDYTVDLCGETVNITGTGSVTLLDTANADYATYGTATVTGVTLNNTTATKVDGNTYCMMKNGETYSFHRMGAALTNVNIRPASSGIYYDAAWACDDTLKAMVDSYGVVVSLNKLPDENFDGENSGCLYTAFGKDTLTSGTTKTGVIIQGILNADKKPQRNNYNARQPIYARAYVKLTDGTLILSEDGAAESLYSAMTRLDQLIEADNTYSLKYLHDAREFYNQWKDNGMGSWEMNTIPVQPKVEDGKLNLLMMGNSYAYYYVEELYALLAENMPEGITEVNIYNAYHSGANVEDNYNKWSSNEKYYTIFRTNAEGRVALTGRYEGTIEQALAMEEDWDYIHLHGTVSTNSDYSRAEELEMHTRIAEKAEPLLDRFHDLFPHAQLLWQRTWASEIGRSEKWTEEYARDYDTGMQFVCDYMCNEWDLNKPYDLVMVNSGAGWREAREMEAGKNLLPFGGLCARLGIEDYALTLGYAEGEKPHAGDGYHDGDIGGAQLINAYTWYETLTGKDCRETQYRPVYTYDGVEYTLSEELVKIFQDAVHGVVSQMPETVQPAK